MPETEQDDTDRGPAPPLPVPQWSPPPPTRGTPPWPSSPPTAPFLPPAWVPVPQQPIPPPPAAGSNRRIATYVTAGLLALLLMVAAVVTRSGPREAPADSSADPAVGCTPDAEQPDQGNDHLAADDASLAASPPSALYRTRPPSSGPHLGMVVASGVFDVQVDPRITTHNLEHGYVVVWYDADTPAADREALQVWGERMLSGSFPKLVIAEYPAPLPGGATIAFTAWLRMQTCERFDAAVADRFLESNYDTVGQAPERGLPVPQAGQQGVVEPAGVDLLLPPLDE